MSWLMSAICSPAILLSVLFRMKMLIKRKCLISESMLYLSGVEYGLLSCKGKGLQAAHSCRKAVYLPFVGKIQLELRLSFTQKKASIWQTLKSGWKTGSIKSTIHWWSLTEAAENKYKSSPLRISTHRKSRSLCLRNATDWTSATFTTANLS